MREKDMGHMMEKDMGHMRRHEEQRGHKGEGGGQRMRRIGFTGISLVILLLLILLLLILLFLLLLLPWQGK